MALPLPGAGNRGLLSFRLLGFPVTVHASFLLIAFALGATGQGYGAGLVWMAVVTVSVLAHELGHALVAPREGEPRIDLFGMAGLTRWQPGDTGRWRRVAVSVAGPAAGVVFGFGLLALRHAAAPERGTLVQYAFDAAVFVNLFWGLVNLLPMLPLDGGNVALALMPGRDERTRARRTAVLSLVTAVAAAVLAVVAHQLIAAAFVVFIAAGNVSTLRGPRKVPVAVQRADRALHDDKPAAALAVLEGERSPVALLLRAAALLRLGQPREAMDTLLTLPPGMRVDAAFEAAVLLANGQEALARDLVDKGGATSSAFSVRELALVLVDRGKDAGHWLDDTTAPAGVQDAMLARGRWEDAAHWGERAVAAPDATPLVAFNLACAYAKTGDAGRAIGALDRAVALGLDDPAVLDDADLASLRGDPAFASLRARLGRPPAHR